MSINNQITVRAWFDILRGEGLLGVDRALDGQSLEVHLDAFLRSWTAAQELDAKCIPLLTQMVTTLNHLTDSFRDQNGALFYGDEPFEDLVLGLYGAQLKTVLKPNRIQRRLLIHSEDCYQARLFGQWLAHTINTTPMLTCHEESWLSAYEQQRLAVNDGNQHTGQQAYNREVVAPIWILSSPELLTDLQRQSLIHGYPLRHRFGLGSADVLVTISTTAAVSSLPSDLRQLVGLHGVISIPTLEARLHAGCRLSDLIRADVQNRFELHIDEAVLAELSAALEGRGVPKNRNALLSLICHLDARECLDQLNQKALATVIGEMCERTNDPDDQLSPEQHLRYFTANRLSASQNLPALINEVEQDAYLHAAKVAKSKRPNQAVRMQDIADVLGVPRQTASRKWHSFGLEMPE